MTRHSGPMWDDDEPEGVPLIPFLLFVWVPLFLLSCTLAVVITLK